MTEFFIDTSALICLSGLEDPDLQDFKNQMEKSNSELSTTHIQMDEKTKHVKFHEPASKKNEIEVQSYQQKIEEALKSLRKKGISVQVEPTKIAVFGVSRFGHAKFGSKEIGQLYDELRKEIDKCEKAREHPKTILNLASDAAIAVSALDHDFLVTCDKCLSDSWRGVIGKHGILKQQYPIPKVIYAKPFPNQVAKQMLAALW